MLPAKGCVDALLTPTWAEPFDRTHINNDLEPYVCLFEDCNNPEELYSHSEDWLKHMRRHTLRWYCKSKSHSTFVFESGFQYEQHMRGAHKSAFTDDQLRVLTKRIPRTIGPMFECCPLCRSSSDDVEGKLEDHIVGHMRFLAQKSVPPYYDEDEEIPNSEHGSNSAGGVGTRSTIKSRAHDLELTFDNNDSQRDSDDLDPKTRFYKHVDTTSDRKYPSDFRANTTPAVDENPTSQSTAGKGQYWRWICCQCGGDNSYQVVTGCVYCCHHKCAKACTIYNARAL